MKQERKNLPKPADLDDNYFIELRSSAEKLLKNKTLVTCNIKTH